MDLEVHEQAEEQNSFRRTLREAKKGARIFSKEERNTETERCSITGK